MEKPTYQELPNDLQQLFRDLQVHCAGFRLCEYYDSSGNWVSDEHILFTELTTPKPHKEVIPWKELKKLYR